MTPKDKKMLQELLRAAKAAQKKGSLPPITPKKYGMETEDEYWEHIRKLALPDEPKKTPAKPKAKKK